MTKRTYENKKIRVFWDSQKCIHSENCVNGLPQVFDLKKKPWIDVNATDAENIKRIIDTCPSGALSYEMLDSGEQETTIRILKDGPFRVEGKVRLLKANGTQIEVDNCFALCRCGQSRKKPFCDGTHSRIGYKDG